MYDLGFFSINEMEYLLLFVFSPSISFSGNPLSRVRRCALIVRVGGVERLGRRW
jgi:hypothetical protein